MIETRPQKAGRAIVLYTSDLHGHVTPFRHRSGHDVGGISHLASAIREIHLTHPDIPVFWVDCGDSLANGMLCDLTRGEPMIDMMARHGMDALVVGNHEFDHPWGREAIREAAAGAAFPFLAANILDERGCRMAGVGDVVVVERGGVRCGIAGMTTPDASLTALPENIEGLTFLPVEDTLPACEEQLRQAQVDFYLLAAHAGPRTVRRAAERSGASWLIVGGHVDEPVVEPQVFGRSWFVKAGCYGDALGVAHVEFADGAISRVRHHLVPIGPAHQPADPETEARLDAALELLVPVLDRQVAYTEIDLLRNDDDESLLDNLILDAVRAHTAADVAVRNSTATRADLFRGGILVRHLYRVLPWEETIECAEMHHADFVDVLEHSVSESVDPHVLQLSGAAVRYDLSRPPGRRVREVRLDDGRAVVTDGTITEPRAVLSVALRPFLLQGGLGYHAFARCLSRRSVRTLREVVLEYLEASRLVESIPSGRIVFER